ncbi:MAG: hypothetical protein DRO12_03000 [Thermoprotei archaeon]|nr:MAG: hypothetical protein DRO12_03000 [Thermoprotei archaeon]
MLLADALVASLTLLGFRSICLPRKLAKKYTFSGTGLFQRIAVDLLLGRIVLREGVCRGYPVSQYKGVNIVLERSSGVETELIIEPASTAKKAHDKIVKLTDELRPRKPVFVIDMVLWDILSDTEKNEFYKQFLVLLSTIRSYLFDDCLVIAPTPPEVKNKIGEWGLRHKVVLLDVTAAELFSKIKPKKVVMLDPYAPTELKRTDLDSDVFILGGIIDKEFPRPYATYTMYLIEEFDKMNVERRSLRLWGSVIGVPDRLNKVVEIVLNARWEKDINRSIVDSMSFSDKFSRLVYETQKLSRSKPLCLEVVKDIAEKLSLRGKELEKALNRIKRAVAVVEC